MENRSSRPQRNRRHSRRAWPPDDDILHQRPIKRLFTPEIKRMLKDWLIRRRENPYPSRDEKKRLAIETGLTYTQICNWFANWRRKLKNSEREKAKKSWGHLIKNYNINARGNVEQFSISSEDSIWEEEVKVECGNERHTDDDDDDDDENYTESEGGGMDYDDGNLSPVPMPYLHYTHTPKFYMETVPISSDRHSHSYTDEYSLNSRAQCFQISSTTSENEFVEIFNGSQLAQQQQHQESQSQENCMQIQQQRQKLSTSTHRTKYKQQMMEKYLRDTHERNYISDKNDTGNNSTISDGNIMKIEGSSGTLYNNGGTGEPVSTGTELSKWLESAAKFRPNKNNYFIEWNRKRNKLDRKIPRRSSLSLIPHQPALTIQKPPIESHPLDDDQLHAEQQPLLLYNTIHHKDELDAAEALANLAFNCRQRMLNSRIFQNHALST